MNQIWSDYASQDGMTLALGAVLFTFQIYGDFSGYSDIAIGTARLFGVNLMRNFNFPYFSRDIAEFWRKWHISLTTWFRDYIYIPLGGSRCARWKVMRNTLIIFLVSGFWHGANWTFIIWGAYHALLFFPLMILGMNRKYTDIVSKNSFLPSLKETLQMLSTFILAVIGWIIFRSENISQAYHYIANMFTKFSFTIPSHKSPLLWIFILILVEWLQRDKQHALQFAPTSSKAAKVGRYVCYYTLFLVIFCFAGSQQTFIYFQF